ncbi:MAG: hypothetical protein HQ483_05095 [Rhodospirillales bacterium]|nr:hypothetical protein [Rhodospirillales bacterium]
MDTSGPDRKRPLVNHRTALWLVLGLTFSGCVTPEELKPAPTSRYIKTVPQRQAVAPPPVVTAQKQTAKAARVYPEPAVLDGLSAQKVEELLGLPEFKRSDEPAEIWQYRVKNCTLDLFMYETLDSTQRSVAHFETRATQGSSVSAKDCFTSVLKAAPTPARTS